MDINKKTFIVESFLLFVLLLIFGGAVGSIFGSQINVIDEGQFGAWASQMLTGKILYTDIYSTYGPLYTYPLFVVFKLLGPDPFFVRVYLVVGSFLGGVGLLYFAYKLGLTNYSRLILLICLGVLPIMTVRQGLGYISIGIFVQAMIRNNSWLFFVSGIITTVTFLISPEIAIFACIVQFLSFVVYFISQTQLFKKLIPVTYFFFGIGVIGIPFLLVASIHGWLVSYLVTTRDVLTAFSGANVPNGMNFPSIIHILFESQTVFELIRSLVSQDSLLYWMLLVYLLACVYILYKWIIQRWTRQELWIGAVSLFGILLYGIVISRPGIGHIFFILSPVILILLAFSQKLIRAHYSNREEKLVSMILVFLIVIFFMRLFMIYRIELIDRIDDISTYTSRKNIQGYSPFFRIDNLQLVHFSQTLEVVQAYSHSDDTLFFLSDNPMLYLLSKRTNPTRYDLPYIANSRQKRFEILNDLKENRPGVVLYDDTAWEVDGISNKTRLPEVYAYILENYTFVGTISGIEVYKLTN